MERVVFEAVHHLLDLRLATSHFISSLCIPYDALLLRLVQHQRVNNREKDIVGILHGLVCKKQKRDFEDWFLVRIIIVIIRRYSPQENTAAVSLVIPKAEKLKDTLVNVTESPLSV
jgi:hypothetical protein